MNRDIDVLLAAGNQAQREKLEENGHKGGFENVGFLEAYTGLINEIEELNEAFEAPEVMITEYKNKKGYQNIRHEAADIANFAHMIILACDKELSK